LVAKTAFQVRKFDGGRRWRLLIILGTAFYDGDLTSGFYVDF
jgi:hypothetical protein